MKYDDASWHSGGNFPKDLPDEAGATHIGMFVAWALLAGLAGSIFTQDYREDLRELAERRRTPGEFFFEQCDGKFVDELLNDEGNAFAGYYYDGEETEGFLFDYTRVLMTGNVPSVYHIADTWANFDLLKPVFDDRFAAWRSAGSPRRS